ncbi:helix-turn-helix transcriptional regulator [Arthrobacter sp. FB24]|uniref:helix-turn-helix transcriptional regulator n=1 Tax=Arthrobacter sp. (strain FB24) TaxID=290399 RepID=UPI0005BE1D14|nr:helix-turn-helix transcriptional regulator [Arthrobacter sp. FB24]
MWADRAERARQEIAAMAATGMGVAELHAAALAVVHETVPFQQACWAGVDPATLIMTSITNWPPWPTPDEYGVRFAETEYAGTEPNPFAQLTRRPMPAARLSDVAHRDVVRSVRLNDLLRPQGLEHELRAVFRTDDVCWAVGGLFRESGPDFTDREVDFLSSIAAALAAATRVAVRVERPALRGPDGPVIVLVGPRGEVRAATPAAATWLAALEDQAPGRFGMTLYSVVGAAKAAASGTARMRMRDVGDHWVVLQASRLITGDDPGQMVVTVEPATTHEMVTFLLAAYGATPRERDVCLEVVAGSATTEIAEHLYISPHTVHDHLKSLFEKVGVGSRGELVARLLT